MAERIWIDILVAVATIVAANVVFNNFERHLPLYRRIIKHGTLLGVLAAVGLVAGRIVFWSLIGALTVGQVVLHAWYFPRHGVNGLTAEPRDKYLELVARMKRRERA